MDSEAFLFQNGNLTADGDSDLAQGTVLCVNWHKKSSDPLCENSDPPLGLKTTPLTEKTTLGGRDISKLGFLHMLERKHSISTCVPLFLQTLLDTRHILVKIVVNFRKF